MARSRRWTIAIAAVAILALTAAPWWWAKRVSSLSSQSPPKPEPAAVSALNPWPCQVAPNLYMLGESAPSAVYVVRTDAGLVLVDAGLDRDASKVKKQMTELGLDWRSLKAILITHVHGDHSGGAERLRAETGAKVYAGRGDAVCLRAGGPRAALFSKFVGPELVCGPTTVDVELDGDEEIRVGDAIFRTFAAPGHTPGSMCYIWNMNGKRAMFTGDVVMSMRARVPGGNTLERPLGTYAVYLSPRYRGNVEAYLATLRRLKAMPPPDLVLPGHPRSDPVVRSPTDAPVRWARILDEGIRELEQLHARYSKDGLNFLDDSPTPLCDGLYYLGDLTGVAVYLVDRDGRRMLINAPGPGLLAIIDAAIKKLGLATKPVSTVLLPSSKPAIAAGLAEVQERGKVEVISPASPGRVPFARETATLQIAGESAFLLQLGAKTVAVTGGLLSKTPMPDESLDDSSAKERRSTILRLTGWAPDVWIPSRSVNGQNANLYDDEWKDLLFRNL
jgi:metallo-beta-lactamase class B